LSLDLLPASHRSVYRLASDGAPPGSPTVSNGRSSRHAAPGVVCTRPPSPRRRRRRVRHSPADPGLSFCCHGRFRPALLFQPGAYYASDYPGIYGYGSPSGAALADAGNLSPAPNVTVGYDASATGAFNQSAPVRPGYVQVTVSWTFNTITSYPGIPSTWNLAQSEIMEMAPITPSNFP
jgi:hypothetical protein